MWWGGITKHVEEICGAGLVEDGDDTVRDDEPGVSGVPGHLIDHVSVGGEKGERRLRLRKLGEEERRLHRRGGRRLGCVTRVAQTVGAEQRAQ